MLRKALTCAGVIVVLMIVGLVILQFIPYGRNFENPPVVSEPDWNSPETRQVMVEACYDCHSNETRWPWYSSIAPVSWLVTKDVIEGRNAVNFSEWGRSQEEADDVIESIQEGEMPPVYYIPMHPKALLSAQEKQTLIDGLVASGFPAEISWVGYGLAVSASPYPNLSSYQAVTGATRYSPDSAGERLSP